MQNYKEYIKILFDSYKCKAKYDIIRCLPVYDGAGTLIAYLRPITQDYRLSIKNCAELMGDWRAQNPSISTSTFEITKERTESWLDNLIIGRDDRLLFMVATLDGEYIGHIGYSAFDYVRKSAEIDSVMRGVKSTLPGIMTFALKTMLWWGKNVAKIENIELSVDLDNDRAIDLYRRCDFVDKKLKALVKVMKEDEVRWDIADNPDMEGAERYSLQMVWKGDENEFKFAKDDDVLKKASQIIENIKFV